MAGRGEDRPSPEELSSQRHLRRVKCPRRADEQPHEHPPGRPSIMSQLKQVVDPFGEVNVHPGAGGKTRVVATILMQPHKEGAQTGIALDGSGSMRKLYGLEGGGRPISAIFGAPKKASN